MGYSINMNKNTSNSAGQTVAAVAHQTVDSMQWVQVSMAALSKKLKTAK